MPALTTLSIDDGADTPVSHDFVPRASTGGVSTFVDTDGIPVGDSTLTVSSKHGNRHKVSIRLRLPQTATLAGDGNPTEVVSRTAYVRIDFDFDSASTEQEREDAIAFATNLLAADQTEINSVVVGLQDFY